MQEPLTIPEDPRLARQIRWSAAQGTLSHAVILSGPGDLPRAARFLAAALECASPDAAPCGGCPACRKVLRDIHPDVITVRDDEHKSISTEILRRIRADAWLLPNEGRRKVYIFPDCALLEAKTQNVLLKVLEEGPPHAAFLFCAASPALLLPTIRSRCAQLRLTGESAAVGGDEQARALCRLLCQGRRADIAAFCTDLERDKLSRDELRGLLSAARDLLTAALALCYGGAAEDQLLPPLAQLGKQRLARLTDILQDFIRWCGYNTGVGHLTGALAAALTEAGSQSPISERNQ